MKERLKACSTCGQKMRGCALTNHFPVCDGIGTYSAKKHKPRENNLFYCDVCTRDFTCAMGIAKHSCTTRLRRNKLSVYDYTAVNCKVCQKSGKIFWTTKYNAIYHPDTEIALRTYRARASFKFNIYSYPNLFNLELIKQHGWYSPGGRSNSNKNVNLTGVSRDHLYSVSDGWNHNIEPSVLSHPANCNLILHNDNIRKGNNSSITLMELKQRIELWSVDPD
jgi:hypothetical protein